MRVFISPSFLPHVQSLHFVTFFSGLPVDLIPTELACCPCDPLSIAKPHGSNAPSTEWSTGPHEPYWRTNTSFSPPPPRWDFRFQSERLPFGLHDGVQHYGSATSSDGRDSRSWVRGNHPSNNQYSPSDGAWPFFSSPSDISQVPQWTPPAIQGIHFDDYETTRRAPGPLSFTHNMEGTSANPDSGGSYSSRSDGSDYEPTAKSHQVSHCNFSSRRSFMPKAIHPLSFPTEFTKLELSATRSPGFPESDTSNPQRDAHNWSSGSSSVDFADASESFSVSSEGFNYKCGLCERFLSQRSPWSSRRIIKSGDMPVAGVLSCRHVFHAECLEQTTLKTSRDDPPCPLCLKSEEIKKSPEQGVCKKKKIGFPRLKPSFEDGPSKPWSCTKAGDCVEGALHAPSRNTLLVLNKNRIRKSLSLKGSLGKENPGKLRMLGAYSSQLFSGTSGEQGAVGCSNSIGSPSMKR